MAYYCLHVLHWKPSDFLSLTRQEKAFIAAAAVIREERRG